MLLADRACGRRECVVSVTTNQTNGPNHENENHREHDSVLGDILTLFLNPESPAEFQHTPPTNVPMMTAGSMLVKSKVVDSCGERSPEVSI